MGEHGEGDVPVPAHVAADFVLVQAALVLRGLEALLDRPACPGDPHQLLNGGLQGGVSEVVGDFVGLADAAAGQSPPHPVGDIALVVELGDGRQPHGRPVVDARALRAVTARDPLPGFGGGLGEQAVDAGAARGELGLGHGQHVADAGLFQHPAEAALLSVGGVRCDPGDGQRRGEGPQRDAPGQLALGGEVPLVGDFGRMAAFAVLGPGLGQVELAVDQGPAAGRRVGGEDTDLAVLGAAGGSGVLALDPGGGGALLDEPGVVDDEDAITLAELVSDVFLQVVADVVRVPLRSGEQVLQAIGGCVACLLGQLPAVLSGHWCEQAAYVVAHAAA